MYHYFAFGRRVRSDFPVATLPVQAAPDDVDVQVVRQALAPRDAAFTLVGADPYQPCNLQLWRHGATWRFEHACSGQYELDRARRIIACDVPDTLDDESVRLDLVGRLLPLLVHDAGDLCLHASAVRVGNRAVLFAAVKGTGKSSLAAALVAHGATLIGDDAVAVQVDPVPVAFAGSMALRVRADAFAAAGAAWATATPTIDGKLSVDVMPSHLPLHAGTPVDAVYLIAPAPAHAEQAVTRDCLAPMAAAVQLQQHGKLGDLLGGAEANRQFLGTLALVSKVPSYTLSVARDLSRLPEVINTVRAWHPW
ncbi:hypothetical protein [Gemmatimonas sp.]|uniref:hypothetical protein n=1 Tax=Gemmatimonas sp. TaxID=1962908 RepID=UPI0022CB2C6F|nr:hypothetical protein [Gemmatimonas sp.]MCZ8204299.1 hypothetical protein [Gemmatimonas sp.]